MSDSWDDFEAEVKAPLAENEERLRQRALKKLPTGKEAGIEWDGQHGEIRTGPTTEQPTDWSDIIRVLGQDPNEVEVYGNVRISTWEAQTPDGIQLLHSFRANLRRKSLGSQLDLEKLHEEIANFKPSKKNKPPKGDFAYLHCVGDTQIGKDPLNESKDRFLSSLNAGIGRLRELRESGRSIGSVYLPWNGDCIESVNGHYPSQLYTVTLSLTEQVRAFRHFMLAQIKAYAGEAQEIVVTSVPGNHDEAYRLGSKAATKNSDSWSIDVAAQVSDILAENPDAFGHVSIVVPKNQDLTISLDIAGTATGFAHGHQFPGGTDGWKKWWSDQAHGCQDIGDTTLLIAAHKHHFRCEAPGRKTFIQLPPLDGGSQWWVDRAGQAAPPGIVTLLVGDGGWRDLAVLS